MSADNWAVCPRCWDRAQREHKQAIEKVQALYGKVPVEDFDEARDALKAPDLDAYTTFREDYEFYGAEDGVIEARYTGRCSECGLSARLNASERFWPDD